MRLYLGIISSNYRMLLFDNKSLGSTSPFGLTSHSTVRHKSGYLRCSQQIHFLNTFQGTRFHKNSLLTHSVSEKFSSYALGFRRILSLRTRFPTNLSKFVQIASKTCRLAQTKRQIFQGIQIFRGTRIFSKALRFFKAFGFSPRHSDFF